MTINDQTKHEKLQYDINREAVKTSVLSSGKLLKYEYLTDEDILPFNQQHIIKQARFSYSPLGKAFEKQIKTIEDQGEKQVEALNTLKSHKNLTIKKYSCDDDDTPLIFKQKEIFNKPVDERREKITDLAKKVNSKDLIKKYKGNTLDLKFDEFDNAFDIIDKIRDGKIDLSDVKNNQKKFKSYLREIKKGNKKHRSKAEKNTLYNVVNALQSKKRSD